MASPTAAEIQAPITAPTFQAEVKRGGSWVDVSAYVVDTETSLESASGDNGLAFGSFVSPGATLTLTKEQITAEWEGCPVRIKYGFAASDKGQQFVGLAMAFDADTTVVRLAGAGWQAIIERVAIYSPLFRRRPIATKTTLTSIDDPNEPAYAAGMINYILWQCGGRPLEQVVAYPDADFYYSLQRAAIAPDWTWIAGENAWDELGRLCRAAGGQIYQGADGVVRYVEPLSLADTAATHLYTDASLTAATKVSGNASAYGNIQVAASVEDAVSRVECRFTERRLLGPREVYRNKPDLYIVGSASVTLTLDTQLPLYDATRVELHACKLRGGSELTADDITYTIDAVRGQRTTVTLTNPLAVPITLYEVALFGRPLAAIEEGNAYYAGSTSRPYASTRQLEDNPLIQSASHARRLCRMVYDFATAAAQVITLTGCGFDPRRFVGETVSLTSSAHGYSARDCRIVAIRETKGSQMDLTLAPIDGLPKRSNCWIIGTSYSGSDIRELSY